jgi:hypothetical protein
MVDSWFGVFSGSALDDPDHISCVDAPAHSAGAVFFSASVRRIFSASVWPTPAHFMLPASNYRARKFARLNANASTGFRPHFEQGLITTEHFNLRDFADFSTWPLVRCHFQ